MIILSASLWIFEMGVELKPYKVTTTFNHYIIRTNSNNTKQMWTYNSYAWAGLKREKLLDSNMQMTYNVT